MTEPLSTRRAGPVVHLVLDRPALHNAFDAALIARLTGALEEVAADDAVRVVVLSGAGASFSAGADLNWMRGMAAAGEAENRADALALARLMRTLDELPRPTIARVHGAAFGGGVGLVACCDIAIGVPGAKFGLTESRLGLLPAVISPYVVAAIGPRQARRWFATAEVFDAAQALRMGLLHEVVEPEALDAAIERQIALGDGAQPRRPDQLRRAGGRVDNQQAVRVHRGDQIAQPVQHIATAELDAHEKLDAGRPRTARRPGERVDLVENGSVDTGKRGTVQR